MSVNVVRLKPYQYIHILDNNTNVTRTLVGPLTYTLFDHEHIVGKDPLNCICVPPYYYCIVENPLVRDAAGKPVLEKNGQVKIRFGDQEIRFEQPPFPLYPGETLLKDVTQLTIVKENEALRLMATRNFDEEIGKEKVIHRRAGDEWMIRGLCTYIPRIEVEVKQTVRTIVCRQDQAIKLRARSNFKDATGVERIAGEEWLEQKIGAYMPDTEEEFVELLTASVLTEKKAIHVECVKSFTDRFGTARKIGEKWLVTVGQCTTFIATPNEKVITEVPLMTVGPRQYCVVQDVVDAKGKPRLGYKELRRGPMTFFLHPDESLEGARIKDIHILGEDEAVILSALQATKGPDNKPRAPGEKWMIRGPCEYTPSIEVKVEDKRRAIPLDKTEGVYIRDKTTGHVRAHIGSTIMLTENEELWDKPLTPLVEELLATPRLTKIMKDPPQHIPSRNKSRVVSCNVPHNALVQVYDYKRKKARVILGPDLVMLMPDEEFTELSLSGGKPKRGDAIKSIALYLGPDFMTDILTVETLDHARLQIELSYNWEFDNIDKVKDIVFSVPDFVGDACKAIASRIRGFVASETFDSFHRNSAQLIQLAVFGCDDNDVLKKRLLFPNNGLVVTAVDIHSVDPVDPKTREALTKSVQLAIEITTKSQEAIARHHAASQEQQARGKLTRQIIQDKAGAEKVRMGMLSLEATNAAIESTGASKAESKAEAQAKLIDGETDVAVSEKKAQTMVIGAHVELDLQKQTKLAELDHRRAMNQLETKKIRALALVEAQKAKKTIEAVGRKTIKALAEAGPATQARLLKSLGLKGYLITDGSNAINLFSTAKGMTAGMPPTMSAK